MFAELRASVSQECAEREREREETRRGREQSKVAEGVASPRREVSEGRESSREPSGSASYHTMKKNIKVSAISAVISQ